MGRVGVSAVGRFTAGRVRGGTVCVTGLVPASGCCEGYRYARRN